MDTPLLKPRNPVASGAMPIFSPRVAFAICTAVAFFACGDPTTMPNPADMVLHVVSGDSQVGAPFEELPDPIVVQVVDTSNNQPVFNQVINFRVVEGGGSVFAGVAHTNQDGIAQEYWTLGSPGPQKIEARAVTGDGEKVIFGTFSATAIEPFDSAPEFIQCLGTEPTWRPDRDCEFGVTWVDSSVTASFRVVNADSLPIPNVFVRFEIDTAVNGTMLQGGAVYPDSARTDSSGVVTVTWTLGPYAGENRLLVSAHGVGVIRTVDAWAYGVYPPPPHDTIPGYIRCFQENTWWRFDGECLYGPATVGTTIPVTFQVVARDTTPLGNVQMYFSVDTTIIVDAHAQTGSVVPYSALTDSAGTATVSWTLGQYSGTNRLFAYAVGSGVTLEVAVTATGVADSIPIDSVPAMIQCKDYHGVWRTEGNCAYYSVPEGTAFPAAFRVVNLDTLPLAGVDMEFEITEGGGTVLPQSAISDGQGEVTVMWTVGSYNVGQQLTVSVPSWQLDVSVRVGVYQPQPEKIWWENAYGGDWTRGGNWSGGRVPRSGDTVIVSLTGDYTVFVESSETLSMGSLQLGSVDTSTTQSLYIDRTDFNVERFGAVHPSGVILVDSGATYTGDGLLFVVGGEVHLIGGSWETDTRVDSGEFVFEGAQPKSLQAAEFVGYGGKVVWRSTDTLLVLEDSAFIVLRGADLIVEDTMTIAGGYVPEPLVVDSASTLVFTASSTGSTYLQLSGVGAYLGGEVAIEASAEPQSGTVFDLIRLLGGATLSGMPTLVTPGYTLSVNPEAGVGLRVIKN